MKNQCAMDVEKFIADNCHSDVGWPCVHRTEAGDPSRKRVLLWGDLAVDVPVRVAGRITPQFLARWRKGEPPGCEWEVGRPSLGGFVGSAAPVAATLGCDVHIATVIPLPAPALIRTFLESRCVDSQNVVACPGPAPVSVKFRFTDRSVVISHPGVSALATPRIPSNLGETFDAVLADAGRPEGRLERLELFVESSRRRHRDVQLGIVGRGDLSAAELRLLSRKHCWLFLSEAEAREAARRAGGGSVQPGPVEAIAELKQRLGPSVRLVVSSRDRGISLCIGTPEPRLFASSPFADGARHALSVNTLLSSMRGLSDEAAIEAGVCGVEGHIDGSWLPAMTARNQSPMVV
jgi:hypothetical protein